MKFLEFLSSQWGVIETNLTLILSLICITVLITWKVSKSFWAGKADAAIERNEYLKQKIEDLNSENTTLLTKLEEFDQNVSALKTEIDNKPNITVSHTEPANSKDGDIWVKPS